MAAAKINTQWDEDIYGNSLLLVQKNRGKLNLDEVEDALRYDWRLQGHYVMLLNATEATCGADWDFFEGEKKVIPGNFTEWKKEKNARYAIKCHHSSISARNAAGN